MGDLYEFPVKGDPIKIAMRQQLEANKEHDEYYLVMTQEIAYDIAKNKEKNRKSKALLVGVSEYQTLINVFSRRKSKFVLPEYYNSLPIYLLPLQNYLHVVSEPSKYWYDFLE
jgi:hypothetical protein